MTPRDRDEEPSRVRESLDCNLNVPEVKSVVQIIKNTQYQGRQVTMLLIQRDEALFEEYQIANGTFTHKQLTFDEYAERLRTYMEEIANMTRDRQDANNFTFVNARKA